MKRFINLILLGIATHGVFAQSTLDAGFQLLEKGDFSTAEN